MSGWVRKKGVTDHGELTGLLDDDHTQYILESILTTHGDILIRGASGVERLAAGTSGQFLKTLASGANPIWDSVSGVGKAPLKFLIISDGSNVTVYDKSGTVVRASDTNHDGAVQWAFNNLTVDRVTKEKIVMMGDFDNWDAEVTGADLSILDITQARIKLILGANCTILKYQSKSSFEILGGELDGYKAEQTGNIDGIYISGCTDVVINGTKVKDIKRYGIACPSTISVNDKVKISGVDVRGTDGDYGIYFAAKNSRITSSRIEDTIGHGIWAGETDLKNNNIIIDNDIINCGNGTGNKDAIKVGGNNYLITLNRFINNGRDGVDAYGRKDILILANQFDHTGHAGGGIGVHITGGSEDCIVALNTIHDSKEHGVEITGTVANCYGIKVLDNKISDSEMGGIHATGPNYQCTVNDNSVKNSGLAGIHLINFYDGTVNDNHVKNSGYGKTPPSDYSGIYMHSGINNVVSGNRCHDDQGAKTQKYGIREGTTANYNHITDNFVSNNAVGGISEQGTNTKVRDNFGHITENGGTATVTSGTASKVVDHGCDYTPNAYDLSVHPIESLGSASFWWVDTITSTQFTVHTNANPGQDVDFAWNVNRV